jgi:energy-coupling factor transport system ATP-binding protein
VEEDYIKISNLSFTYPDGTLALKNINLAIKKGEYVVIMGQNGAGKTTLSLFLNGTIPNITGGTVEGTVTVAGLNPFERPVYEMAQKVGVVLQDPEAQLICSDVKAEVAFAAENLGLPRAEIEKRIQWANKIVRLDGMEDRSPQQLSGGQKQRLAIAANLVMQPEIIVLDEPTSQLDPVGTTEVFGVLKDLNEKHNMTVVIAEHKSEAAAEFADRIVVLNNGEIVADGEPHEVFGNVDLLKKVYVKVPDVTMLAWKMKERMPTEKYPITIPEAHSVIDGIAQKANVSRATSPVEIASRSSVAKPIVEVEDFHFSYPQAATEALAGVYATIYDGEFVALIGQNGSGKTTLVKCLLGILWSKKGRIVVDGNEIKGTRPGELAKKKGLVLQNPDTQLFQMSVKEEIEFGLRNIGVPESEIGPRIDEAIKATGLEAWRDIYPFRLSFGDRRKVAVAAIIAMKPRILIFDEPTTGQDFRGRYELAEIAKQLNESGSTVIMITHDMDLVARYAKRTIVMGLGKIIAEGPTREIFKQTKLLEQTFLRPPQITQLSNEIGVPTMSGSLTVDELYSNLTKG